MRHHVTYANVMSTIAVFVALGGGAYAVTTVGPDRNGVIHGCVAANGSLRIVSGSSSCRKAKQRGKHRIPGETAISWAQQGPAGPAGPPGQNGKDGKNALTNVIVRQATGDGSNTAIATCLPGEIAVGGGGGGASNSDAIVAVGPQISGPGSVVGRTPDSWQVTAGIGTGAKIAEVVCATP